MDLVQSARQLVRQILGGTGQSSSKSRRPTGQPESTRPRPGTTGNLGGINSTGRAVNTRPRPGTTGNLGGSGSTGRAVNTRPTSRVTTGAGITGGGGVTRLSATATGSRNPRVTIGAGMSGPGNTFRPVAGPTPGIPTGAGTSFTPNRVGPPDAVVGGRPLGTQATLNGKPVVWLPTGKNTAGWQAVKPTSGASFLNRGRVVGPMTFAGNLAIGIKPFDAAIGAVTSALATKAVQPLANLASTFLPGPLGVAARVVVPTVAALAGNEVGVGFGPAIQNAYEKFDTAWFNGRLPGGASLEPVVPPSQSPYAQRIREPETETGPRTGTTISLVGQGGNSTRQPASAQVGLTPEERRLYEYGGGNAAAERYGLTPEKVIERGRAALRRETPGSQPSSIQPRNFVPPVVPRAEPFSPVFSRPPSNDGPVRSDGSRPSVAAGSNQQPSSPPPAEKSSPDISPISTEAAPFGTITGLSLPFRSNPSYTIDPNNTFNTNQPFNTDQPFNTNQAIEAVKAAVAASTGTVPQSNPFDVNPPATGPANNNSAEVIPVDNPPGQPTTPVISQPTTNLAEFYKEMQRIGEQNIEPIISSLGYEGSKAEWARANEALAYRELLKQMTNSR